MDVALRAYDLIGLVFSFCLAWNNLSSSYASEAYAIAVVFQQGDFLS